MAKGAKARGKRIAFGDGTRINWHRYAEIIYQNNPNVAKPGSERANDLEWIHHCPGHRLYNHEANGHWVWHYDFRPTPGEFFFSPQEQSWAGGCGQKFVIIEPSVLGFKKSAPNKAWPQDRWQAVADKLKEAGHDVAQFIYTGVDYLKGVRYLKPATFRHAAAALKQAALYIGPEGGLHHASAAVGIPAVVLFGGFIPPAITGYDTHTNLIGKAEEFCGSLNPCDHCRKVMRTIEVEDVLQASQAYLTNG